TRARISFVSLASNEMRALVPVVHASFNQAEREVESRFGHPITRRAREGIAPTLEAVYAYGDAPRLYYAEAIRPYPPPGQSVDDCTAIGSGTGWFARDAGGVRAVTMVVDVLNCNREAASYMLPLGVLKLHDHVYWLAQFAGWGDGRYVVLDVKNKAVEGVVNKWGGGWGAAVDVVMGGTTGGLGGATGRAVMVLRAAAALADGRRRQPVEPLWDTGTFSILGFDPATGEVGGAVQSRVFSAGNGVLWADADAGVAATQA